MSKAIKAFAIATVIAAFASVAFAQDDSTRPSQDAPPSPFHRGPWPIQNGFDQQPTEQDLPPAVRREEGHVTPSERDFDKNLRICQPC
jgi:hypothetical protein